MTRVKICCISSEDELRSAVRLGANAVGFVSKMSCKSGTITDRMIAKWASRTPPGVSSFLLTPSLVADEIVAHVERTRVDVVQICDHVEADVLAEVRAKVRAKVVAVIHVNAPDCDTVARASAAVSDALLLDSGIPGSDFQQLGGTGCTHDWEHSARIVAASPVPVWLAGGLNAKNIRRAIQVVQPFGVDLCSGIRRDGRLDVDALGEFMLQVRTVEL